MNNSSETPLYIGIDAGTSGLRAVAMDANGSVHARASTALPEPLADGPRREGDPLLWSERLIQVIDELIQALPAQHSSLNIQGMAIDGTSGTVLFCESKEIGPAVIHGPALMYNDARCVEQAALIKECAPSTSGAHGPQSSLAKYLWLRGQGYRKGVFMHQADYLLYLLTGVSGTSDENNALKLGYDPQTRTWPAWLESLGVDHNDLPEVRIPGSPIAPILPPLRQRWHLPKTCQVHAGTTDSIAAMIATGALKPGDAVTSLGSTLVLKVVSDTPVYAPEYGIYSHRLGDLWLAGGASNTGGAVLKQCFCPSEIQAMSERLVPEQATGLDYYPLATPGERFPIADPDLPPRLLPRPDNDLRYFQGMLESMARIETQGYRLLAELGAPYPKQVLSTGGGARNKGWSRIREQSLGIPIINAADSEACMGAARLAMPNFIHA